MGRMRITKKITACILAILLACGTISMESFHVMAAAEDIPNISADTEVLLGFGVFGENNEFQWEFYGGTNLLRITGVGDMPDFVYCDLIIPDDKPNNGEANVDSYMYDGLLPDMEMGVEPDGDNPVNEKKLADMHSTRESEQRELRPWESFCDQVEQIDIAPGITRIGDGAFQEFKRLVSVKLPNIRSIGAQAFCACHSLRSLTFGKTLEVIEQCAFMQMGQLEVHFQGNAPQMASNVFQDSAATIYYTAEDDSWQNLVGQNYEGTLDWQPTELIESGTFGDGFTWAYYRGMDRLYIEGTGEMPDFEYCPLTLEDEPINSDDRPWASISEQIKEVYLSENITSIGKGTFQGFKQLESVYMPSVNRIGAGAFCLCESLKSLTFYNILQIGEEAFYQSSLSEIHFQGNAPQISENAFYDMTATVYYPASNAGWQSLIGENFGGALIWQPVTDRKECLAGGRIGEDLSLTWTFYDSGRLVISGAGRIPDYYPPLTFIPDDGGEVNPPIDPGDDPGSGLPPDDNVPDPPVIPENPARPVRSRPWETYKLRIKEVKLSEGITGIGEMAFVDAAALAEVSLPESLDDISDYAFANCESLTNFTIPGGVRSIGNWAFGLAGLKNIYFEGDAPDIAKKAFYEVTADAYYPKNSADWEKIVEQDFGGKLTWHSTDQIKDLSSCSAELSQSEYTYDGTEKKPDVTVMDKNKELRKGTDYTIEYSNNINVGTATVTIVGKGNYKGTISKTFTIVQENVQKTNISWLDASLEYMECVYDGTAKEPVVTLKDDSDILENGVDYTVVYSNNMEPGTASVKICGIGAYTGTGNLKFKINKRKSSLKFAKEDLVKTYGDQAFINQLTQETDGVITYESSNPKVASVEEDGTINIKNAGSTEITATAAEGRYYQSASVSYSLTVNRKKAMLSFKSKSLTKTYGDSAFTNKLSKVTDGKLNFNSSNPKVATINKAGKVTIKGVGKTKITVSAAAGVNYSAKTLSYTLKVNPKGTNIVKIMPAKRGITVKWKKQREQTTGYQLQYAANRKFSGAKNVTLKNSTVSKKISKLKAKKKYYVRVRTYKTVSGKKYVSDWSKVKSVTTSAMSRKNT